ncbi:ATP-binding cassette domain-containing protein [Paludibacter jiangxiensis]|uniref:ABC-type nitrate/sulfonate/bicarbonate transport system n=1 Tax=Paludibacter jiangxiensis TaxID=681398 RepID=A0A170YGF4_9BACT|nr:ATP-binding cassette domain-containing protein [Paludibacter jiangxiensis]GAT61789.1 ABC-type nitrate/sulfonate/bicarbonate transport system [Paludibacter jiangxiensis]
MKHKRTTAWILSAATALILWQAVAAWIDYPQLIPSVSGLFLSVLHLFALPSFYISLGATLLRGLAGVIVAFLLALPIGFLCGKKSFWFHYFNPLLSTLRSTPVVAFILLIILWLPTEAVAPTIALMTMFPVLCENIIKGVQSINNDYERLAFVYQINFRTKTRYIYWPSLKPFVESGCVTGFGFGWKAIIMGEVLSKPFAGIGVEMRTAQMFINVPDLIAWTFIAIVVSFLLTEAIRYLLKRKLQTTISKGQNHKRVSSLTSASLKINDITKRYDNKILFERISYEIPSGSICLVTGVSGKGKTTLLNIMAGITNSEEGSIEGVNVKKAYLFQTPTLLPWLTAKENILITAPKDTETSTVTELLNALEISELSDSYSNQLSGGQCQRVALARALVSEPQLLLIDEPFTGLDKELTEKVVSLLVAWAKSHHTTMIIAIHEATDLFPHDIEIAL